MPREHFGPGFEFLSRRAILRFEEIARVARVAASEGVKKLRLTGGEPLLRAELPRLVELLAAVEGVEVALTTNGSLLARHAEALRAAGLARVTVSLDSLDDATFRKLSDSSYGVSDVLDGIAAAERAGFAPIKINAVVRRGLNDAGVVELARRFKGTGHIVRFIEFMDTGMTNGWELGEVVPSRELVERIDQVFPIEPVTEAYRGEVAKRWRYRDGSGELGIIASVTQPFCGDCTRARLSADGKLYTCLFAKTGTDLRDVLRGGVSDDTLRELLREVWLARDDHYSELRSSRTRGLRRIEMSYIGG